MIFLKITVMVIHSKDVEIITPLKYLGKLSRTLNMSLINSKIS